MTSLLKPFKLLSFHDVHLGHRTTVAEEVIRGLMKSILDEDLPTVSCIAFQGDLFDKNLELSVECVTDIHEFFVWLLRLCKQYGIWLRVLEGTPSHDWKQSKLLVTLNRLLEIGCDLVYVDRLAIDYLPNGLSVLYVPDEWSIDPLDTLRQAKACIRDAGLEQVDFIFMHGAFEYQLPEHLGVATHTSVLWEPLVKYHILCGHIHQYSRHGKILVAGSHNRLSHNDESDKGHLRVELKNERTKVTFIKNTLAKVYQTIDCIGLSLEAALETIREVVRNTPPGSFLRLKTLSSESLTNALDSIRNQHGEFFWSQKVIRVEDLAKTDTPVKLERYQGTSLTATNLPELVSQKLIQQGISDDLRLRTLSVLEKLQCEVC